MSTADRFYQATVIDAQGQRVTLTDARQLVIELAPGKELELDLQHLATHEGEVTLRAGCELAADAHSGQLAVLVMRPAACNVMQVGVEAHPWQDSAAE